MKLSFILSVLVFFQVNAASYAQKVSLHVRSASIDEVFYKLTQQTGHTFTADAELIKKLKPISLNLQNVDMKEALDKCFEGQPVRIVYNRADKIVVVKKADRIVERSVQPAITIRGKITNEKGDPLPGALVHVKGQDTKAVSEMGGNYTIVVPDEEAILHFSFLGFQVQEIKVGEKRNINVVLKATEQNIDQVVVIGYGSVARKDLTGSVGQADIDDVIKAPVSSFEEALAGRVAGVQVSSGDGQPGAGVNVVIRGASSLTQSNSPLYVIDGFPVEDPTTAAINPQDILSIDILKDASATAIYGSRAANGVIIVETKKGKPGKTVISANASVGTQKVTKTMDLMDPYQFVKMQYELDPEITETRYLSDRTLESYRDERGYDWQKEMFKTAVMQNHSLSVSGGNKETSYMLSASLFDQGGILINSGSKRVQGRFNIDHNVSDRLKIGLNTNYGSLKNYGRIATEAGLSGSASSYLLYSIWGYRPIAGGDFDLLDSFLDPDIDESNDFRVNPLISTKNEFIEANNRSLSVNAYASYKITDHLMFKASGGFNRRDNREDSFYNSQTSRGTPLLPSNTRGVHGTISNIERDSWLSENTLRYNKQMGKHLLDVLGGITFQGTKRNQYGFTAIHVPNETLGISGLDEGTPYMNYSQISENKLLSFLGRVNYNYRYKYYLTATFRADGSSKFFPENRWGYFPSAALAWRMSREKFMRNIGFISESKLRLSYGATGNNRINDYAPYASLSLNPPADYGNHMLHYSFRNQTPQKGVIPLSILNRDLKWETTTQLDLGYDLGLFKDRIILTADIYRKDTRDLLLYANMPLFTGYPRLYRNIGRVLNKGLELTLNAVNVDNQNFTWKSNFNISFNRNKVLSLNGDEPEFFNAIPWEIVYNSADLYQTKIGEPLSQFYGYVWDGVYQYEDFDIVDDQYVLKEGVTGNGTTNVQPGDIKYRDLDGNLEIGDADRTIIGNPLPKHTGGFANNFSYRGIQLHLFFQWSYGNDAMNANRIIFEGNALHRMNLNQYSSYENRWTPDNPSNTLPRIGGQGLRGVYSSRTIEDASFIRLKTFSLGYDIPSQFLKRLHINSAQVSLSAQNLLTWTKYSGMDPEVSVRYSALTQGFDYSAYPRSRSYTVDIRLTF